MVLDIAISRYDNTTPFGFKLVGGADFDVPLQVVKIIPGSIAEEVGMHVGDVIVRINDIPTNNLSYYDAHQLLACAGNRFVLGILRVNFNKMIPKSGVFKQSEVFKTLNSELVQTEEKKEWTTFLQKPSRPPPKTREEKLREMYPPQERYQSSEDSSQAGMNDGDTRTAVQNELRMQVVKKKKKATSAFGPLTPQERPIYLPGGRKWRNAKDAFNEQFIAEVISSQAELIQGTTLGVNFLKYQQPEKDLSFIKNSDVYKLVHDKDPPKSGIELRPELVLAEEDVRKVMHDETIFQPRKSRVFLYQN